VKLAFRVLGDCVWVGDEPRLCLQAKRSLDLAFLQNNITRVGLNGQKFPQCLLFSSTLDRWYGHIKGDRSIYQGERALEAYPE